MTLKRAEIDAAHRMYAFLSEALRDETEEHDLKLMRLPRLGVVVRVRAPNIPRFREIISKLELPNDAPIRVVEMHDLDPQVLIMESIDLSSVKEYVAPPRSRWWRFYV